MPLGFLFGIVFLIFARPEPAALIVGGIIALGGLLIRAWASGHIRKNENLAVSGPYAFTRNPLYLGSFFLGLGFAIASGVWWIGIGFAVLYLGIYFPVMRVESEDLTRLFGEEYKHYVLQSSALFSAFRQVTRRWTRNLIWLCTCVIVNTAPLWVCFSRGRF